MHTGTQRSDTRLYRLVCDAGWLRAGLDAVFANKGSHTPGLNGITKQHVDGRQRGRERCGAASRGTADR